MWKLGPSKILGFVIFVFGLDFILCKDLQIPCDINARNTSCPDGYCCVRDDFLFTEIYCKSLGTEGSSCIEGGESHFECPCQDGFYCATNIHGLHSSVFGKCRGIPGYTTEMSGDNMTTDGMDLDMTTQSGPSGSSSQSSSRQGQVDQNQGPVPVG